jgi:hypothetical protein
MASDLVLIPIQPSPYDVWASAEIVQLVRRPICTGGSRPNALAKALKWLTFETRFPAKS